MAPKPLSSVPDLPSETPKRVEASVMEHVYLECHAEGHWWAHAGDTDIVTIGRSKRVIGFTRVNVCKRCGETRRVTRGQSFQIMARNYKQPQGFGLARTPATEGEHHRYVALRELLKREGIDYDG